MRKLALETVALLSVVVAAAVTLHHIEAGPTGITAQLPAMLAMFASGGAAFAALVAEFTARTADQPALRRIAAAMIVYAVIVVPATAAGSANAVDTIVVSAARHTASLATVGLLLASLARFDRPHPWPLPGFRGPVTGTRGTVVAVAATAAVALVAAAVPQFGYPVVTSRFLVVGIVLFWLNGGVALIVAGLVRRRRLWVWTGFGMISIIGGNVPRVLEWEPILSSPMLVPGMRLLGLALILCALLRAALQTHQQLVLDQERLRDAQAEASRVQERMSEQAHELRNALAGVDGAAQLLAMDPQDGADIDRTALRAAMSAELDRMRAMLETDPSRRPNRRVRLKALLEQLVLIRRTTGMAIEFAAEEDLTVDVPPEIVAQVVTNVLANCERHAPGARVWVEAYRLGDRARIQVQDDGPGVPAGKEEEMLRRGAKGGASVGQGIGLHVCRQVLDRYGGRLRLAPAIPERPGCTVIVDLPVEAPEPQGQTLRARRSHRGSRVRWVGSRRSPSEAASTSTSTGGGHVDH
ncbi:two-component system OmpR family sensor kinase [Spinactinospora alkalitolerans]|uniref:histidine kinase n=1 Tax=Spinactinospora alkalitolerans TaxID=687207 RepID=A0A852U4H9_9ACTN|nr:HAMP domain-containing sensor histidine kinase [Spinactinospora alkalitolerans]NYE50402.1 two-component system OmpR family sensor kinase [Spinactinospora alkalitolerans]